MNKSLPYANFKHYYIPLKVQTNDLNLELEHQAIKSFTAHAYASIPGSKNYLHIDIPAEELELGKDLTLTLTPFTAPGSKFNEITYLVCMQLLA